MESRNQLRGLLADALRADAAWHESGRFAEMGRRFHELEADCLAAVVPMGVGACDLATVWSFWDSWLDERNHGFPGFTENINKDMWPALARSLADRVVHDQAIEDPLVLQFRWEKKPGIFERLAMRFLQKR